MKKAAYIASIAVICAGLKPALAQETQIKEKNSSCKHFIELVENKQFGQAHGMWVEGDVSGCTDARSRWAIATVLASMGELMDALEIATELVDEYPSDQRGRDLKNRIESLMEQPAAGFFADLLPYPTGEPGKDQLIAWIEGEEVVVLETNNPPTRYFPNVHAAQRRYHFASDHTEGDTMPAVADIASWKTLDLGPSAELPDGKKLVSAVPAPALGMRRPRAALFLYDPQRPRKIKRIPFCKSKFNYLHPTYHASNQTVIFSSDMDGGEGGMDLWKVTYDGHWGEPQNLGAVANSPHNELYPFALGDTLIFSSDRPDMGHGGVDLYIYDASAKAISFFGPPVNTPFDDFGLVSAPSGKGYMLSNRAGSARNDRIFSFAWEEKRMFFEQLQGRIEAAGNNTDRAVHLLNSEGDTLQTAYLDSDGRFVFDVVRGMRSYEIALSEKAGEGSPVQMELMDQEGNVFKRVKGEAGRRFLFELLTPEDYYLERMVVEDQSILDADIIGKYLSAMGKEVKGRKIVLQDAQGQHIAESQIGEDGAFRFKSVKPDSTYTIQMDGLDPDGVIHITDARGKLLQTIAPDDTGEFIYVRIDPSVKTIILTNELKESVSVTEGAAMELPDIFFGLNKANIQPSSEASLRRLLSLMEQNPNIRVELTGHTDSRGSAAYNLELSQKRINAVIQYLKKEGVASSRISGKGLGESQPVNQCRDGMPCSEEEHAANRRIEFSIYEIDP